MTSDRENASGDDLTWYVVMTDARAEWLAHKSLRLAGFSTLYLHYQGIVRRGRKRMLGVMKPLFPRYLFVGIAPGQSFYQVHTTPGVASTVQGNHGPAPVPAAMIEDLRARGDEEGRVDAPKRIVHVEREAFAEGEEVNIVEGPLKGLSATVVTDDGHARVLRVNVMLFGRVLGADVPATALMVPGT